MGHEYISRRNLQPKFISQRMITHVCAAALSQDTALGSNVDSQLLFFLKSLGCFFETFRPF
jgi:hypothetical protein